MPQPSRDAQARQRVHVAEVRLRPDASLADRAQNDDVPAQAGRVGLRLRGRRRAGLQIVAWLRVSSKLAVWACVFVVVGPVPKTYFRLSLGAASYRDMQDLVSSSLRPDAKAYCVHCLFLAIGVQ